MNQADLIWMNGELVAWEDAKVHVLTHALHYGTGVFEGIRAYDTPRGTAIFRHADHVDRLFRSAGMYLMDIPYTREELRAATHETIVRNGLQVLLHPPARLPRRRARWACSRSTARSTWRSRSGSGAPTSATRASSAACAARSPRSGASRRTP